MNAIHELRSGSTASTTSRTMTMAQTATMIGAKAAIPLGRLPGAGLMGSVCPTSESRGPGRPGQHEPPRPVTQAGSLNA